MAGYLGSVPVPQATQHRETFTATAGQTTFNTAGYTPLFIDVYLNGVHLSPADITATNGSDVVLGACVVDDIVDVVSYTPFEVASQTFTGTTTMTDVVAASLDISGDIDIDGTTNLDVVDIDGAVNIATTALVTGVLTTTAATVSNGGGQFNGAINVGVDDTGYDVKFFGATSGKSLLWDESADSLIVTGTTTLVGTTNLDNVDVDGSFAIQQANSNTPTLLVQAATTASDFSISGYSDASGSYYLLGANNYLNSGGNFATWDGSENTAGIFLDSRGTAGIEFYTGTGTGTLALSIQNDGDIIIANSGGTLQTATAGASNFRAGVNAGNSIASSGNYNTLIGDEAGTALTIGDSNVAIGYKALFTEDAHGENVAVGVGALQRQDAGTNAYNNAFGNNAGTNITDGLKNVFVGHNSGAFATTSDNSVFIGYAAGQGITGTKLTGNNNIAIGYAAGLLLQGTATNNLLIGEGAGAAITVGEQNTIIGGIAGDAIVDTDANTLVGYNCGGATTGTFNAFYGRSSGSAMTDGVKNTIIGSYNGNQNSLDLRVSDNNIVLSDGDGNPRGYYSSDTGSSAWNLTSPIDNQFALKITNSTSTNPYGLGILYTGAAPNDTSRYFYYGADTSAARFIVYSNGNVVNANNSYGGTSDVKLKENIIDASSQWDDIKALTVRKYSMKADSLDAPNMLGVIAQELETAGMGGLVFESPDLDPQTNEDLGTVTKQVNYSILYMKAVKALQEAMTRIEALETKVAALEG